MTKIKIETTFFMRYASAGSKMVQQFTMEEKSSLFGMLDRIEKVVNQSYTREAVPTLVEMSHRLSDVTETSNVQPLFASRAKDALADTSPRKAVGAEYAANVIDVSRLALSRGEGVGESDVLKMGENVILEKRASGAVSTPVLNRFPPEFYQYFDIFEDGQNTPPTPKEVA